MKALVTGGAGFIGSNLVDELVRQNYDVTCLDINPDGYWNKNTKNYVGDICNYNLADGLMKGVDYVFHLAADVQIQSCMENPIQCYNTNVIGTATVLEAARNNDIKNFVFSSTSAIYKCDLSIQSEHGAEDCSLNPYASSKKSGEDLCKMYSNLYGLHTTVLRYFNVYGKRQHATGQYAPVLGIFMKQNDEDVPLTITGDGSQRRDFINVQDVVSANILAAERNLAWPSMSSRMYNVGFSTNHSVQEIANMISTNQTYIPKRDGEIQSTCAVIDRIQEELQWKPTIDLESWLNTKVHIL